MISSHTNSMQRGTWPATTPEENGRNSSRVGVRVNVKVRRVELEYTTSPKVIRREINTGVAAQKRAAAKNAFKALMVAVVSCAEKAGKGRKWIAGVLGCSISNVQAWTKPRGTVMVPGYLLAPLLDSTLGDGALPPEGRRMLLDGLAARSGFLVIERAARDDIRDEKLAAHVMQIQARLGELAEEAVRVTRKSSPGGSRVCVDEATSVLHRVLEVERDAAELRNAMCMLIDRERGKEKAGLEKHGPGAPVVPSDTRYKGTPP